MNGVCAGPAADALEREVVELYQGLAAAMLRYAAVFAESPETAQDALHEAFLRYFIQRSRGEQIRNPRAWLLRVMRNYVLDLLKTTSNREVRMDDVAWSPASLRAVQPDGLAAELPALAICALTPRERECLRLRREGFSYRDIGSILGIRSGTVGALLARAHSRIRKAASGERRKPALPEFEESKQEAPYAP